MGGCAVIHRLLYFSGSVALYILRGMNNIKGHFLMGGGVLRLSTGDSYVFVNIGLLGHTVRWVIRSAGSVMLGPLGHVHYVVPVSVVM